MLTGCLQVTKMGGTSVFERKVLPSTFPTLAPATLNLTSKAMASVRLRKTNACHSMSVSELNNAALGPDATPRSQLL